MAEYTLYHGDCLGVMKGMPDASVFTVTDPPYGKSADKGTNGFGSSTVRKYRGGWDAFIPDAEYFNEILRVSQDATIFDGNYFAHLLPPSNCWLVWDKKGDIKFENPFADCELIYTTLSGVVKKYTLLQQGFITASKDQRLHPTQKPTELIRAIIDDMVPPDVTVLDPFMGSGTMGVACAELGRNFIGIEKDATYYEIARNRIEAAHSQLRLF